MTNKLKNLIFDLDGTITVDNSTWMAVHLSLGKDKEANTFFKQIERDARAGKKIDANRWADHDIDLWKGESYKKILKAVTPVKFFQGAKRGLITLKAMGYNIYIISGTFDFYLKAVLKALPEGLITDYLCHEITTDKNGNITGHTNDPNMENKAVGLRYLAKKHKFSLDSTITIGNGSNDIAMMEIGGFNIAFRPYNKRLKKVVDVSIDSDNFYNVLRFIRGI